MLTMEGNSKMLIILYESYLKNYISNKGNCSKMIAPYISHITSSVDRMNKSFTKLDISDITTDDKYLAGNIKSIISPMGLVLIQPLLSNLLYLDTPLFLYKTNSQTQNSTNYIYLGKINDIFGSVGDPIYSIYSALETINALDIGDKVYFLPNHPDTQFMCIQHTSNNNFNIIKKKKMNE